MKRIIDCQPACHENFHGLPLRFKAPSQSMGLHEEIRALFVRAAKDRFANTNRMALETGVEQGSLSRFLNGKGSMRLDMAAKVLDVLGARLVFPARKEEAKPQTRDIEFVKPRIVGVENGAPPPASEDYLAVPLAEEAIAAGPGLMPQDALRGWVIVWRHHDSVRFRTNLVAVEIGKGQTSMVPHLHPGDIVLVDKADRSPDVDGKIMLVCDPDGGCAVKRVSSRNIDGDIELVFYSDNAAGNPPRVFRLDRDYGGDLHAAIGGRVVWAWSDMTRK
jgi:hypothetical protein